MVSASYTDDAQDFPSSSLGGLIISAGNITNSGSSSGDGSGGIYLSYYSGSTFGTASHWYENQAGADYMNLGMRTAIANNNTGPNRKFYVAGSTISRASKCVCENGKCTLFRFCW